MFRIFSKATGDPMTYERAACEPAFGRLPQYLCTGRSGQSYLGVMADGALSEYQFSRLAGLPAQKEAALRPARPVFCGDCGGYPAALFRLSEKCAKAPDLTGYYAGEPVELTDELRQRSLSALVKAFPAVLRPAIEALDSFAAYRNLLAGVKSAVLVWEYGPFADGSLRTAEEGTEILGAFYARPEQPAGFDAYCLGQAAADPDLCGAKSLLLTDIFRLIEEYDRPVITGDWDLCDPDCPEPTDRFIYNRCDYLYGAGRAVGVRQWGREQVLTYSVNGINAMAGLWLVRLSQAAEQAVCDHIFALHPGVRRIRYRFALHPLGEAVPDNHYHIVLPASEEVLMALLRSGARNNLRRCVRRIETELGGYTVTRLARSEVPLELVRTYFAYKEKNYSLPYTIPPERYLDAYHVSHVYRLDTPDHEMAALLFSCEQGDTVYLENLTYDPELTHYAMGKLLYDRYLAALVGRGQRLLYLEGGDYEYKTAYASTELRVYSGEVWRSALAKRTIRAASAAKGLLRKLVRP